MTNGNSIEKFEDTKGVIRICISKKNRQHNGQKKNYKRKTFSKWWLQFNQEAPLLAATLYQVNTDKYHKLWNSVSTERYILYMQVLLECCYIWMESSQWENWSHLYCRKLSFLTTPHCQILGNICSTSTKYWVPSISWLFVLEDTYNNCKRLKLFSGFMN